METCPYLPPDIIRKIVGYSALSNHNFEEIQLVSHLWNELANIEFSKLANLPPIDDVFVVVAEQKNSIHVRVKVGKDYPIQHLLRYGFQLTYCSENTRILEICSITDRVFILSALTRVKRISLKNVSECEVYTNICLPMIFRRIKAESISFTEINLSDQFSNTILQITRQWRAPKVQLVINEQWLSDPTNFLLQLADCVDALHIGQNRSAFHYPSVHSLFDQHSWKDLVEKLFTQRVSKIRIVHDNDGIVTNPLDHALVDFGTKVVRTAIKPLWFEIESPNQTCGSSNSGTSTSTEIEGGSAVLRVEPRMRRRYAVTLKHDSREKEAF